MTHPDAPQTYPTPYPVHVDAPKHCDFCEDGEADDYCDGCGEWACYDCGVSIEQPVDKIIDRAIMVWLCKGCAEER